MFRAVYFHRTVRAIDLTLRDLFADSRQFLFPNNPIDHLAQYQRFSEWSLLVDVGRWHDDADPAKRLAALNVLVKSAVRDADLHDRVERTFRDGLAEDSAQTTAVLVRLGTWAVLNVPTFSERFVAGRRRIRVGRSQQVVCRRPRRLEGPVKVEVGQVGS